MFAQRGAAPSAKKNVGVWSNGNSSQAIMVTSAIFVQLSFNFAHAQLRYRLSKFIEKLARGHGSQVATKFFNFNFIRAIAVKIFTYILSDA